MNEMILTGLLIAISWYVVRRTIPLLLEWLDCMSIDETDVGKEDSFHDDL